MSTKSRKIAQQVRRSNVRKLQRAGLLGKVNLARKSTASERAKIAKYKDVIRGKAAAVKAPSQKQARQLRKKFGLKGSGKTLIIPREKGERFRITKQAETPVIKSTRKVYGQTVHKTIGEKFSEKFERPKNAKAYYTIPHRARGFHGVKRKTFASFDELLYYLQKYEVNFEDIEDRIEIEEFEAGSERDQAYSEKIARERAKALKRKKYRRKKKR